MADRRLFIVADDPLARAGLAALLADEPDWEIVGQSSAQRSLAREIERLLPDVILWDLGWEPEDQLTALAELVADSSEGGPVIAALIPNKELARTVWSAGVRLLLNRDSSRETIIAALQAAANDLAVFDPSFLDAGDIAVYLDEPLPEEEPTDRELEVLELVAEGLSNKGIAQQLGISEHTVKFHLNAVMGKLGVQSRTAAVVRAARLGLIAL